MNQQVRIQGLPRLLRSIASRLEGNVDGLNKELLTQSAKRIDELENVAIRAATLIRSTGHSKTRGRMVVYEDQWLSLKAALESAEVV